MSNSTATVNLFGVLAVASVSATLEIILQVAFGMVLAYFAVIDTKSTKVLANLYYYAALPCLNLYQLASEVSIESLKSAWIVPMFAFVYFLLANGLARITFLRRMWGSKIPSPVNHAVLVLSVTFNNTSSLPIVFVTELCTSSGSYLIQNSDKAIAASLMYMSLYAMINTGALWTYGSRSLKNAVEKERELDVKAPIVDIETVVELAPRLTFTQVLAKYVKLAGLKFVQVGKAVLTPPFIALVLGLLIGCITLVKEFFIKSPPPVVASIFHVFKLFSGAAFPLIMIVLGINLYNAISGLYQGFTREASDWRSRLQLIKHNHPLALFLCVFLRLVIIPLIGICIAVSAAYAGIVPRADPIMILVLLVEASTPSANNLGTLSSMYDGAGSDQMSEILLVMYMCAPFTLSILAGCYMFLVESIETSGSMYM